MTSRMRCGRRWSGWQHGCSMKKGVIIGSIPPYQFCHAVILDLRTGESLPIAVGDGYVGDFIWSPDSLQMAYAACHASKDFRKEEKSSVLIYSLASHTSRTILEVDGAFLTLVSRDDRLLLEIVEEYPNGKTIAWSYDWASDQLALPTSAPTP
jgi:hypothetical protein